MKQIYIAFKSIVYSIIIGILLLGGMTGCTILHEDSTSQSERQTEREEQAGFAQYGAAQKETAFEDETEAPYIILNGNIPSFTEEEKKSTEPFEQYSDLDMLGRCGMAYANICRELMPKEERKGIGQIKPSGWHTVKYDNIDGKYLYNRCHLIGYQLAGENANERNLITGTRYLNTEGMLPFEDRVADYVQTTGNHVLYRVTPVYEGDNLVADGVEMEAFSVEDEGAGICFHVYVYNCQPGIEIDYATGDSSLLLETRDGNTTYILNTNTEKFHLPSCGSVRDIKEKYKEEVAGNREDLILEGYEPCKRCNP